jgi:predicted porin
MEISLKKSALVVFGGFTILSPMAYAQSSVTLYGIIDEGINYNSNMGGHRSYAMQSGVGNGNRWGLRGTEDLGGGIKSLFVLENGFDLNTGKLGQGGLEFGRQAYVGLGSNYGSLTLGRQYDAVLDMPGPFEVGNQWGGNVGAHPGDLDNFNGTIRTNNSVKYRSVSYGGMTFEGVYSLGGVAGDVTRNQAWSAGAAYQNGPFAMGVGYMNVRDPNLSFFGNGTTGTPSAATANTSFPVFSGFLSAHTYQVIGAGGSYTLGAGTLGFTYSNTAFKGLGDLSAGPNPSGYQGDVHFNNAEVNFKYQFTPALLAGIAYDYTNSSKVSSGRGVNDGATYNQGMLSVDYFFSKRTDVYVLGIYQKASGTDSRNLPAVASINNQSSPSSNDRQALVRVALRHRF